MNVRPRLIEEIATPMTTPPLPEQPAWVALAAHRDEVKSRHLRELFDEDPTRGLRYHRQAVGLYFDFSKNLITDETLSLFAQLVRDLKVEQRRDAMLDRKSTRLNSS